MTFLQQRDKAEAGNPVRAARQQCNSAYSLSE
ncbi:hypothetical protein FHR99_002627 [Litorivivens lipolytica]|uniref:Uncharacterized protein n=1 Tax=Litorivivens lipolytica TaxID=1524264 RepID=A0A7W4W6E6_9GAMM|nr:hypothetical protein [Litorivivens lipolytica]